MIDMNIPWGKLVPADDDVQPTRRISDLYNEICRILEPEWESWPTFDEPELTYYSDDPYSEETKKLQAEQNARRLTHNLKFNKLRADASQLLDWLTESKHIKIFIRDHNGNTYCVPFDAIETEKDRGFPLDYGHNWIVWVKGHLFAPINPTYQPFAATYEHYAPSVLLTDKRSYQQQLLVPG